MSPGDWSGIAKLLIVVGVILVVAGLVWPLLVKSGLGRLPGDIVIRREGFTMYFPITTSVLVSVVVSALLWFFGR